MNNSKTVRMLVEVTKQNYQQQNMHVRPINECKELRKTTGCCGGYCGSHLWQKLFISKKVLLLRNSQNFSVGDQLLITLPWRYSIIFQSSLWLLNSLIFILLLTLLPNTLISLLIGIVGTLISFISIFKILHFFQLTPLSFIEIQRKKLPVL